MARNSVPISQFYCHSNLIRYWWVEAILYASRKFRHTNTVIIILISKTLSRLAYIIWIVKFIPIYVTKNSFNCISISTRRKFEEWRLSFRSKYKCVVCGVVYNNKSLLAFHRLHVNADHNHLYDVNILWKLVKSITQTKARKIQPHHRHPMGRKLWNFRHCFGV